MSIEDYKNMIEREKHDAKRLKKRLNKLSNKLFPWPWWSKEKMDIASKLLDEIRQASDKEKLPSEIHSRLDEKESKIHKFL